MLTKPARLRTLRRGLVLVSATAVAVGLTTAQGNAATRAVARSTVANSAATWTTHAKVVGAPRASDRIAFQVVLPLRDAAGAAALADAVSDSRSKSYGHYLSAAQFNARFAPSSASVASVRSYLSGQGFAVSGVAQGNRWISASGTVRQVEKAFATTLRTYSYLGRQLRGTTGALSIPASIAGQVSGILGVSQPASLRVPATATAPDTATGPNDTLPPPATCSTYWDQHEQVGPPAYGKTSFPTPGCGYTATQLRTGYDVQSSVSHGITGKGVTVAIIDAYASPTMLADADQLSALEGEPQFATGQYTETVMGPFDLQDECGGEAGWNEEESLDVEAVHAMAPGANVHYVGAQDCDAGIDAAVNYVIQNHVASLVSNSYGFLGEDGLGSEVALEHSMYLQAAAEGIGFYFSSGDDGDNVLAGTPHPEPDYPASDPTVTSVGGTSLGLKSNNTYLFETAWGNELDSVNTATSPSSYVAPLPGGFLSGAGGGVSALFTEPAYQKLAVPSALAKLNGPTAMRVVPDVASDADPETGFLIDIGGVTVQIGGTSLAVPTFTGFQALASQGRRFSIGFANPLLYVLNLSGVAFHDVKAPSSPLAMMTDSGRSLLTMGQDSSLTATKGYDDTTGLGSPNGPVLLLGEKLL